AGVDVLDTEDSPGEPVVQTRQPEHVAQVLVRAARRDAGGHGDSVERVDHAFDGREFRLECLLIECFELLVPAGGQLAAQVGLDPGLGVPVGAPDESLDHLGLAERPAQLAQYDHVHLDRQALAVDEYAITIEDQQFDGHYLTIEAVSAGSETYSVSPVATWQ